MQTYKETIASWDADYDECLEHGCLTWDIQFSCMGGVPTYDEQSWYKVYHCDCENCPRNEK